MEKIKSTTRNFLILTLVGLLYFLLCAFPNSTGAADEHTLFINSGDESFQYPNLIRMVTPGKDAQETRFRWIAYGHYIYGYPFYLYSALVVLPLRWIFGDELVQHTQLILLTLRQLVSVLPMILGLGVLVYLQTRFKSLARSLILFIFLLAIPGVVRQNLWWWHPDALAFLFAMLTLFLLERDGLRFGRGFFLAAVACGLTTGTKIYGFFFFAAVGGYLLAGLILKRIRLGKAALYGALFMVILFATLVISNPLLLNDSARAKIFKVQADHNYLFTHGWEDDDPYATGITPWLPIWRRYYGQEAFLIFGLLSALAAAVWGRRKLLHWLVLAWVLPYSVYVIVMIAVKPDHYWLPVMLPLLSCSLSALWLPWEDPGAKLLSKEYSPLPTFPGSVSLYRVGSYIGLVLVLVQFLLYLQHDLAIWQRLAQGG
ncbi:MAG TPA: hypothetical protein VIO61_03215 [Anaerolineaceae bacterium]